MTRGVITVLSVSICLFLAAPATAHHSFQAEYDRNQPITLKGKVTKVEWQNPHVYYYVDVTDANGQVANWAIEVGAPNGLYRAGWRKESLKAGEQVTVEAYRAKKGGNHANGRSLTLSDGKRVFSGQNDGGPGQ